MATRVRELWAAKLCSRASYLRLIPPAAAAFEFCFCCCPSLFDSGILSFQMIKPVHNRRCTALCLPKKGRFAYYVFTTAGSSLPSCRAAVLAWVFVSAPSRSLSLFRLDFKHFGWGRITAAAAAERRRREWFSFFSPGSGKYFVSDLLKSS